MPTPELLGILFAICVILAAARTVGYVAERLGQPAVVGEIVAGILLGPSLLGWIAPTAMHGVFPQTMFPFLYLLAQIGLIFFMFIVGLDLNPSQLTGRVRSSILISNLSVLLPMLLGAALSGVLVPYNSDANANFAGFALFLGASMSRGPTPA